MLSASTEGPVFFYSCKPSTKFDVLGYVGMYNIRAPEFAQSLLSHPFMAVKHACCIDSAKLLYYVWIAEQQTKIGVA